MATNHHHINNLLEKLNNLQPERINEVEDFIDFLAQKENEQQLTHRAKQTSEPSFKKIWDNPEDSAYDDL